MHNSENPSRPSQAAKGIVRGSEELSGCMRPTLPV
jgi:hypothetical protein